MIAWLGLWLSLNATTPLRLSVVTHPTPASEVSMVVKVGKFTVTAIYIQPLQGGAPIADVGVGVKVF